MAQNNGRKAKTPLPSFVVDRAEVAKVAYALYEQRGRQAGNDFQDWLQAEAIVRRRCAAQRVKTF